MYPRRARAVRKIMRVYGVVSVSCRGRGPGWCCLLTIAVNMCSKYRQSEISRPYEVGGNGNPRHILVIYVERECGVFVLELDVI